MELDELLRNLGRRVAELRAARGLTQEEFAEKLGVGVLYVQSVERGAKIVSLRQVVRITRALGARPAELFEAPASREVKRGRPKRRPLG